MSTLLICERAQTVDILDLLYTKIENDQAHTAFPTILKQARLRKHLKSVTLTSCSKDIKLYPVNILQVNLIAASPIPGKNRKLVLSYMKPHKS